MTLSLTLQIITSVVSIMAMWKMGDRSLWGPIFGLLNQVAWSFCIVIDGLWGFIPLTFVMVFVHTRNLIKWRNTVAD